jgi:hypothetical protein
MATRPGHGTWTRRMANNAATALLAFALVQVALTSAIRGPAASYLGLILLMGMAIPFARQFESRWRAFEASETSGRAVEARFRRDRAMLWAAAILFPMAWVTLYRFALGA